MVNKISRFRCSIYSNLTLDFFSTLSVELIQGQHCQNSRIAFQLLGHHHTFTLDEFNNVFALPTGLDITHHKIPPSFDKRHFWCQIADSASYNPTSSKATNINAHKVVATGIFVRGDSINVVRN